MQRNATGDTLNLQPRRSHCAERLLHSIQNLRSMTGPKRQRRAESAAGFATDADVNAVRKGLAREGGARFDGGTVEREECPPTADVLDDGGKSGAQLLETRIHDVAAFFGTLAEIGLLSSVDDGLQLD